MTDTILVGSSPDILRSLPSQSIHCCVTSPPYWGLRDYGVEGQLGLEKTPEEYVVNLTAVFREVKRVLRDDGTLWLNLGDSYASNPASGGPKSEKLRGPQNATPNRPEWHRPLGFKPKDLIGIPWRVAFALQSDGWYLRSDIIWSKPNPMPESVRDRPTKAHEYIFLLSKSARYYYDQDAIKEPAIYADQRVSLGKKSFSKGQAAGSGRAPSGNALNNYYDVLDTRNKRSVWRVTTKPFKGAHFAVFPPDLIRPCILAGCPAGGVVLDPFFGAGTTGLVAKQEGRHYIGVELNPEYAKMAKERIVSECPMDRLV